MTPVDRLYEKLCREQAQSEHSARVHPAREARRLGACPPADAFRAISAHAASLSRGFEEARGGSPSLGQRVARLVGESFSAVRHGFLDRLMQHERSYRATLLGLRHSEGCARLLALVSARAGQPRMEAWCARMLAERAPLLADAEAALAWFADHPSK